jgi:hypothetical protein
LIFISTFQIFSGTQELHPPNSSKREAYAYHISKGKGKGEEAKVLQGITRPTRGLGMGSFINSVSANPNVEITKVKVTLRGKKEEVWCIVATRNIAKGEELSLAYHRSCKGVEHYTDNSDHVSSNVSAKDSAQLLQDSFIVAIPFDAELPAIATAQVKLPNGKSGCLKIKKIGDQWVEGLLDSIETILKVQRNNFTAFQLLVE